MKKIRLFPLCAVGALVLTACSETSQNYHTANVISPDGAIAYLYADDTSDTIQLYTTDNWEASTSDSWITIDPSTLRGSISYNYGYIATCPIYLTTTVNTTDNRRTGIVSIAVSGPDDFNNTMGVSVIQYPVLNVESAGRYPTDANKTNFYYMRTDTANTVTDTLVFNVHQGWTLETSPATIKSTSANTNTVTINPVKTSSNVGGYTKVALDITKNTSETDTLSTVLKLTSSNVTTPITILQLPKKKSN